MGFRFRFKFDQSFGLQTGYNPRRGSNLCLSLCSYDYKKLLQHPQSMTRPNRDFSGLTVSSFLVNRRFHHGVIIRVRFVFLWFVLSLYIQQVPLPSQFLSKYRQVYSSVTEEEIG